nr:MAG TPA: hypothetical protein [Caudoviricetes sp.]
MPELERQAKPRKIKAHRIKTRGYKILCVSCLFLKKALFYSRNFFAGRKLREGVRRSQSDMSLQTQAANCFKI